MNRPSGAKSVRPRPNGRRDHGSFEQHLRTPGDQRRPGLYRDHKHLTTVQAAEEEFPTVTRPERPHTTIRRNLLPTSQLRIPLDIDFFPANVRLVGHPESVWRKG